MLDRLASEAAARVLSHLLRHDAAAQARLAPFEGRHARIEWGGMQILLAIGTGGARLAAGPETDAGAREADVRIRLAPRIATAAFDNPAFMLRNMRIEGDADFAAALAAVLPRLRLDPEEELAPFIGDIGAVRVTRMLRSIHGAILQAAGHGARTAADYLAGERPVLAARAMLEAFAAEVATVEAKVEAVSHRIAAINPGIDAAQRRRP
jgi:ubiquinone biosynthesis accessory factor UbiJ